MAPSSSSLVVFAIAGAIAAAAVLALAMRRMRARREEAPAPIGGAAPRNAAPIAILAAAAAGLMVMGLGLYAFFNDTAPPAATAIDTAVAGASRAELARHLERVPNDGRAWVQLARVDFADDRFADAAAAYEHALATAKVALDAGVWCEYADALGMAQGGSLTGRPRELVMRALAQNPAHPKALEMAGSAAYEAGEYRAAGEYWRRLLPQLAGESRARRELAAAIARADDKLIPTDPASGAPAPGK